MLYQFFLFQAEDGIRDLVRSRGLGDVYKRQVAGPFAGVPAGERARYGLPSQVAAPASPRLTA